jgi:hypothetical protein
MTQALKPVEYAPCGYATCLVLENVSDKDILSVTYTPLPKTHTIELDLLRSDTEGPISPTSVYKLRIPEIGSDWLTGVKLVGVVFADGTSEGDSSHAAMVRARWVGMAVQEQKIRPLLDQLIEKTSNSITDQEADEALSTIANLPETSAALDADQRQAGRVARVLASPRQAEAFKFGLHQSKLDALHRLERLKASVQVADIARRREACQQLLGKMRTLYNLYTLRYNNATPE